MELLYTKSLRKEFGGVVAVSDIDFSVKANSITGLIGPNGAGKTTLFNTITGLDFPTSGSVFFNKKDITNLPSYKLSRIGIARTYQNIRLFNEMSVIENVMIGRHYKGSHPLFLKSTFITLFFEILKLKKLENKIYTDSYNWLSFFKLNQFSNILAKSMPYGRQREIEIARALATDPLILFLDEPAAGMNPQETKLLMENIIKIKDLGITVVLIEHDMKLVMKICDYITVLNYGRKIAEGTPREIQNNQNVIEAYLGKKQ